MSECFDTCVKWMLERELARAEQEIDAERERREEIEFAWCQNLREFEAAQQSIADLTTSLAEAQIDLLAEREAHTETLRQHTIKLNAEHERAEDWRERANRAAIAADVYRRGKEAAEARLAEAKAALKLIAGDQGQCRDCGRDAEGGIVSCDDGPCNWAPGDHVARAARALTEPPGDDHAV